MENILKVTKALSDSNRIRIIYALYLEKELCSCQISEFLGICTSTVSRHMSQLQKGDLIKVRKQGKWTFYSLSDNLLNGNFSFLLNWIIEEIDKDTDNNDNVILSKILLRYPEDLCKQ